MPTRPLSQKRDLGIPLPVSGGGGRSKVREQKKQNSPLLCSRSPISTFCNHSVSAEVGPVLMEEKSEIGTQPKLAPASTIPLRYFLRSD